MHVGFRKYRFAKDVMSKSLEDWHDIDIYTLAEAALLIIEKHPDDWADTEKLLKNPPPRFIPIYKKLRISATRVIDDMASSEEDASKTCIEYELHTDKANSLEYISEVDGLSIQVSRGQLEKWLKAKGITAKFFNDDELAVINSNEKALGSREKNTLLVIIAALAREAKIDITTHAKSALIISKITQEMGASIDDETISKKLKLIPDALERRIK
jgi:hypothetical protein